MAKVRIDALLVERGVFPSRARASAAVMAGEVLLGPGRMAADKPGQLVAPEIDVAVRGGRQYVSRGGDKLASALDLLGIDPAGQRWLDVGASTGGFTDCLLQRGAEALICVDVGYNQLAWSLRDDPRVTVMERVNARELDPASLPFAARGVVADVSFISLTKVLPAIVRCIDDPCDLLLMVKPQFEVGPKLVGKNGVVREPELRRDAVVAVAAAGVALGLQVAGVAPAGLHGPKGNRETFLHLVEAGRPGSSAELSAEQLELIA